MTALNILVSAKVNYITMAIVSIFAGLSTYSILSYMFVDVKITIQMSIVLTLLVLGLIKYYSKSGPGLSKNGGSILHSEARDKDTLIKYDKRGTGNFSTWLFVGIFAIAILISCFAIEQDHVFISWNKIGASGLVQLGTSIILCFFLPGYALVLIITKKYKIDPILKTILAYLLSILITGLTAYIAALTFDKPITEIKYLFIGVYLSIFLSFLAYYAWCRIRYSEMKIKKSMHYQPTFSIVADFWRFLKTFSSELLVFGSIFALLIIGTYNVYGGGTIGDQWYHQGRALLFMSGSFREAALSGEESFYPPLQSAFIAAVTTLSGIPLVNTYVSIAFLNMVPIFAFYYFFQSWVPARMKKAGLLACSIYAIGSGFGWIYLLNTVTTNPISSAHSSLETLRQMGSIDIVSTSNFVFTTAPQFSTALTYIALPAGFALLGILRMRFHATLTNVVVITALSILGILAHDEFFIFIIIASLLPIIFKMEPRSYIYVSFLLAFLISCLIEIVTPGDFLFSHEILGVPLLLLMTAFVLMTWIIYLTREHITKPLKSTFLFFNNSLGSLHQNVRFRFLAKVLIVSFVAYAYLLTFIVLSQLPLATVTEQTRENTIPWYLYPMRFGVPGILGFTFILTYLFAKFEKQILVFGVLIVIPFIIGPYYDEHRFTKYMMVGLIGFASLMIYSLLNQRFNNNPIAKTVLLGIFITSTSISVLLYIGYNSLIYQTQDYIDTLARRHFPSMSDLYLFELLHNRSNVDSKKYNVLSFLNQYDRLEDGVMAKVPAFSGLPYNKIRQSPLTLNASTPDALYRLLAFSDARFILLPKYSIQDKTIITEPARFILEHFKRIYEDNNYILLEVPTLAPPALSPKADIALLYNETDDFLTEVRNKQILRYDNKTFEFNANEQPVIIQKGNGTEILRLNGTNMDKGITVWSKTFPQEKKINDIEVDFLISSENKNKANDVRIDWMEGNNQNYYSKLSKDGLELYQNSVNNQSKKILLKNVEAEKKPWSWYKIRIESLPGSINIYLNGILKIQVSKIINNNATEGISKVGLTSFYNDVEFVPPKIWTISDFSQNKREAEKYYDYYYPLNLLALSKSSYNIFNYGDSSAFSKKILFVSDSLKFDNIVLTSFSNYVHNGGTLVVLNSHNNFSTISSKLFSLNSSENKQQSFASISGNQSQNTIRIQGLVKTIDVQPNSDVHILASYRDSKNETIAPFIMTKNFSNGGKIILINSRGYFNAIKDTPTSYFSSLSNISKLLPIDLGKGSTSQNTSLPYKAFIGKMKISGKATLNSSSLQIIGDNSYPNQINISRIVISKNSKGEPIIFNNISLRDLKLAGNYGVTVNLKGQLEIPEMTSDRDYIGMQVPNGFNMTVNLSPKGISQMEIITQNKSSFRLTNLNKDSKIELYSIKAAVPWKNISLLLKSPELKADGFINVNNAYLYEHIDELGRLNKVEPLELQGQLLAGLDFVDNFNQPYRNVTKTQYITYLHSPILDGKLDQDKEDPRLPGDIYSRSKEEVKLVKILGSPINIIVVLSLIIAIIITSMFLWKKNLRP